MWSVEVVANTISWDIGQEESIESKWKCKQIEQVFAATKTTDMHTDAVENACP